MYINQRILHVLYAMAFAKFSAIYCKEAGILNSARCFKCDGIGYVECSLCNGHGKIEH